VDEGDLAAMLRHHARANSVPGAAVGVLREGTSTTAYYGVADVATGEPVTPASLFSVGSLTKSMVATVIARLARAGRMSLDDPVAAHLPEMRHNHWAEGTTVRDLLANRSGLPLRAALEFDFAARPDADDGALARLVADAAPDGGCLPCWSYTNVGWCLLGRMVETVTGAVWEDAMSHHLAGAGLRETTFGAGAPRRVAGHEVTSEGPQPVAPVVARAYGPAGTTALSTVADLLRFAHLHLEEPELGALRVAHAEVPIHGWLDAWCLGWARFDWTGGPVWGWDGLLSGERSVLRIVPQARGAVALMTNGSTGRATYRSLLTELMDSLFGIHVPPLRLEPSPGAAGDLARFAGAYAWPDRQLRVTAHADSLAIESDGDETEALPVAERVFLVDATDHDNPTVTFGAIDDAGRSQVLYDMLWGLPRKSE
jgi:CubicO group peptidase (beta-lactamase class C family)